ncbi:symmetrical bis(5'-nucleosyl)-tetraphosphatase [Carnimonas bestiolae]|uniref:symmetrical bis(5'-nucleosyl)-tetraphosphatase n=1 Tax=Carnimonas bestiolae TaxID=3402172 RepID=UPI003EDBB3B9
MTTWVVGDVHGCADELEALLEKVRFDSANDQLWLVGDLINRGPRSLGALRLARSLNATMVLGNHDLHFLAVAAGAQKAKRNDTIAPILDAPDAAELVEWLRQRPLLVASPDNAVCMVHAGIAPQWSLADAQRYASEAEAVLRGDEWQLLMQHLYGNSPDRFDESLRGWDRLRAILNVFSRMRFIDASGRLDFSAKLGPRSAPRGFMPWFQYPRSDSLQLLFGHWAALEGRTPDAQIACQALDTGCAWGGALTAMALESGERISVASNSRT